MLTIVSFNANSIRQRLHQLKAIIDTYQPDIIGVQETKVQDHEFPLQEINDMGYQAEFFGQKTHYGVALLSRHEFIKVTKGFPSDNEDSQRRFIAGTIQHPSAGNISVLNGYFPQGENESHPTKYPNKRKFYQDITQYLEDNHSPTESVAVIGDMNISPTDIDIGIGESNRKRWLKDGKCSFLPEEREWLERLYSWGLSDTFRLHHPEKDNAFSWFDYRSRGFERDPKRGLRIDLILSTETLAQRCKKAGIDEDIRAMEKPSDHCPIWAYFE